MRRPLAPSIRVPRPTLAGNIRDAATTGGLNQTWTLGRPKVGTAWELEQFSLTIVGPAPSISEDIAFKLLRGTDVISTFTHAAVVAPDNNNVYPLTLSDEFVNPVVIFDTDTLTLVQSFSMTPANPPNYVDLRYSARLSYA